ncbi:shikimate kinase [Microbacterium amylolyticum]|uniref:Shikimate kinase n=1 Tax=Microbacterium amylolyticum TaxID=936337 RepID=A0ABS4ZE46_9MICO|nr:shikimate kinase [Microbacterium amylolyticum]MBP2435534.1 shikimate kinase [Microbacterium amylolyticum]
MSEERSVALIGPMGAGKTSIGRRMAKRLGLPFRDTDALIVSAHGPIAEIFAECGEQTFRELEREAVHTALERGGVVALGGGAILAEQTREELAHHLVIYLTVSDRTVASRIGGAKRPLLNRPDPVAEWRRIADERRPIYEALAHQTYDTSSGPLRNVVEAAADWAAVELGIERTDQNENEDADD